MTAETIQQTPNILEKAVCISLDLHKPGNRKKVPQGAVEVDADKNLIRVSKALLDSKEYDAITQLDGSIRRWMYAHSLPSPFKSGVYLIPHTLILDVDAKLREFLEQRIILTDNLAKAYPRLIEEAREKLSKLFAATDYPSVESFIVSFSMSWNFFEFSTPGSLGSVSKALFEREKEKAAASWQDATTEARNALRVGFAKIVEHIAETLSNPGKRFNDTLTSNFSDFTQTFEHLNITNDSELEALVAKARKLMSGIEPDMLRKDIEVRAVIAKGMQQIDGKLDGLIEDRPKRRIRTKAAAA